MSKFNKTVTTPKTATINLAGGAAYTETSKLELSSLACTSLLKDKFYESERATMDRLSHLLDCVPARFAAQTAVFARHEFGMRSISHVIAGEIALRVKGELWTKDFLHAVVRRPDDVLEILAYVKSKTNSIPNSLKKGLGAALSEMSEHALAKYKKASGEITMIDAVNLLHPKHTEALEKLITGKLEAADTWETALTQAGEAGDVELAKQNAWADLVKQEKLGYMALLRNLRNILQNAPETIDLVCEQLTNSAAVKKSLLFPYRFKTAAETLASEPKAGKLIEALNDACDISLCNVPTFEGKTLVVVDVSGSMRGKPAEIAALFAATLLKANDADFMVFSTDASYRAINRRDSVLTIAKAIQFSGGGTNFHSIFQRANQAYDRVVILSDMQGWMRSEGAQMPATLAEYKKKYNADPRIYSFDLNGYGTLQLPQNNVFCLAGFSDKVFDIMGMLEHDKNGFVGAIERVEFGKQK
jgi:hypothetical protein